MESGWRQETVFYNIRILAVCFTVSWFVLLTPCDGWMVQPSSAVAVVESISTSAEDKNLNGRVRKTGLRRQIIFKISVMNL